MGQICVDTYYLIVFIGIILLFWCLGLLQPKYRPIKQKKNIINKELDLPPIAYYEEHPNPNQCKSDDIRGIRDIRDIRGIRDMRGIRRLGIREKEIVLPNYEHTSSQIFKKQYVRPEFQQLIPEEPPFMEVGYVQSKKGNELEKMFKLFGRKHPDNKFSYYVINDINYIKIPVYNKNGWEFNSGDVIKIDGFKDKYIVKLYY